MNEIIGWLIGIIGALVAFIAMRSRSQVSGKLKDAERRIDDINNAQDIRNEIQTLDDDRLRDAANKWVRDKR